MEPSARPACHRYKRAPAGRMRLVLALLCTACCVHGSRRHIECQDPDLISNPHNADRKYLLIGSEGSRGSGFGNLLIFFPAAFWFATFSGRNIIISDGSTVGEMCKIVGCGFPFASDLAKAYPLHFKDNALQHVPDVKQTDFVQWVEGSKNITANVVRGWGYQAQSDWWVYFNHTVHCVKKMTGCDLGDIACADRHAYQKLVRGPFKQSLTEIEEKRISGVPPHIKHAMLSLPHAYAPRLDAAVHLRAQFHHFEQQADVNDKEFRLEVQRWLNGTESKTVFRLLTERILSDFLADGKARPGNESRELSVYIAADNEEVKDAFASHLRNGSAAMGVAVNAMKVDSAGIHHVKNLDRMKQLSNNEGMLDLVFDWYSLSLANTIYAWRKGGTSFTSTFVLSAQRVSGTTERTVLGVAPGRGIGTRGLQLVQNKRGHQYFDNMWCYGFLEDFQAR